MYTISAHRLCITVKVIGKGSIYALYHRNNIKIRVEHGKNLNVESERQRAMCAYGWWTGLSRSSARRQFVPIVKGMCYRTG